MDGAGRAIRGIMMASIADTLDEPRSELSPGAALSYWTNAEYSRQRDTLNLIAAENYPSPATLALLGSIWSNKYAEGYPGKRYYAGNTVTDELEAFVQSKALEVFDRTGKYGVNVQVLSGSPANAAVYLAMLEPGDTILSLSLPNGGHLSHLHATSNFKKFFNHATYELTESAPNVFELDLDHYAEMLERHKPNLVIVGFSSYPRAYQFGELCTLAHAAGALVLADIAHISGLVAAGRHDSPFKSGEAGADFVTMTTHKTLRGPRGALLFARGAHIDTINRTIFPGTSGGPHLHKVAAIGQAMLEILGESDYPDQLSFQAYIGNVLDTCRALETAIGNAGLQIISPTQSHMCLVKLPDDVDSLVLQEQLESLGIITNRNVIPLDAKSPFRPSGMRFGTAALASRGMTVDMAAALGELIVKVALSEITTAAAGEQVADLLSTLSWYYPEPA
jgi:glycine hydroxymethyltransferase